MDVIYSMMHPPVCKFNKDITYNWMLIVYHKMTNSFLRKFMHLKWTALSKNELPLKYHFCLHNLDDNFQSNPKSRSYWKIYRFTYVYEQGRLNSIIGPRAKQCTGASIYRDECQCPLVIIKININIVHYL
jgi:hypothetical protein